MPQSGERKYRECEVCGALLVPQREWNAASRAERAEMAADGFRKQGVGPRCGRDTPRPSHARSRLLLVHRVPMHYNGTHVGDTLFWADGSVTWERT